MEPGTQFPQPSVAPALKPASLLRRGVGWTIDYAMVMVPGTVLVVVAVTALVHALPAYLGGVATEVGVSHLMALVAHHGDAEGVGTIASREWGHFVRPLTLALLAVPLIQFGYQAGLLAWRGRTVGKIVTDTRVDPARPRAALRRGPLALRRALVTTTLESGLVSVGLAVITVGYLAIGAMVWVLGVVAFWANLSTMVGPRRRTVADRLAGTVVVRTALYATAAGQAADLGRRVSAATVGQGPVIATAVVQRTADTAGAAGRLAREGAGAVARSAPVQRAIEWQPGPQAQALGAAGVERARQVGQQAGERARQVGGRAQQIWRERQARRDQPAPPLPPGQPVDPAE